MNRNILFIGGAGFIGSNLIKWFVKNDRDLHIHVIEPEGANISRIDGLDITVHRGALSDTEYIKQILKDYRIDTVVHLVSTLIPGSTYDDYKKEYLNIIFPTIELMQICAKNDIKFVYFSSGGTVYGNRNDMKPFTENDAMNPISYYGWSKQMMENSIQFVHRTENLRYLIVRPSNPYGHGQNLNGKQGLVAVSVGKILRNEPVSVWGDGSAIRDYIYINDLAEAFGQLIEKDVTNVALNLGCGRGFSVNDVLAFLKIITKKDFKIEYTNARPVDVSNMVLDITNLKKYVDIDFKPMLEGMEEFYNESAKLFGK